MDDILIRGFMDSDLDDLARLVTELGYPTTADQMTKRMSRIGLHPDHATLVAESAGTAVGMVGVFTSLSYEHDEPIGRITGMVVSEGSRSRGIGIMLMKAAEAWVRERGAKQMALTSHLRRTEAHGSIAISATRRQAGVS